MDKHIHLRICHNLSGTKRCILWAFKLDYAKVNGEREKRFDSMCKSDKDGWITTVLGSSRVRVQTIGGTRFTLASWIWTLGIVVVALLMAGCSAAHALSSDFLVPILQTGWYWS
ncbi:hypothetical protein CBL_10747 [Carabus blaptoides fortunei]